MSTSNSVGPQEGDTRPQDVAHPFRRSGIHHRYHPRTTLALLWALAIGVAISACAIRRDDGMSDLWRGVKHIERR